MTATPWQPDAQDFINLKGKAYLPARRRIQWMRGIPEAHPGWTIDTKLTHFDRGTLKKAGVVEGGFAMFRAELYDEDGRLISTGTKTEYSENFADYVEKAETGAIARCLAVAGYGTESALDIDEGIDKDRIADAPVEIRIGSSNIEGIKQGGRSDKPTQLQITAIAHAAKQLGWGAQEVSNFAYDTLGDEAGLVFRPDQPEAVRTKLVIEYLRSQTFDEVGLVLQGMSKLAAESEPNDD